MRREGGVRPMAHGFSRRRFLEVSASTMAVITAACGSGLATPTPKPAEPGKPSDKPTAAAAAAPPKPTEVAKVAAPPVTSAAQTEVEFWFWADDPYQASLHTDSLKKFQEQNPNIVVKTDFIATVADQRKKLLTAFAAQAGMPDVSHAPGGWLPEFYDA